MRLISNIQLLKYWTDDGLLMHGLLSKSKDENKTVIITVFGMTSSFFSSSWINLLMESAKRSGADVLSANNRGAGLIFPFKRRKSREFIGTAREPFKACVYDISAAVRAARALKYKNIIIAGHSTGCQKAIYYLNKAGSKSVKGVILLAPVDDYNATKRELGSRFSEAIKIANAMDKHGKGDRLTPSWISQYTAKRFLSYAVKNNPEARIFNYDSKMNEFGAVRIPVLAIFGSKDKHIVKSAKMMLSTLEKKSGSRYFKKKLIRGADHNFNGKQRTVAKTVIAWAERVAGEKSNVLQ